MCLRLSSRCYPSVRSRRAGNGGCSLREDPLSPLSARHLPACASCSSVDVLDCLGCGNCVDVCPGKKGVKALAMKPLETQLDAQAEWDYCVKNVASKQHLVDIKSNVKNSQFATPLFEFSGACSGCGETPYVKLISQLFGDHEMVANATGCSSIYSGSVPSTPYTTNDKGTVRHGLTHSSRTSLNSVSVCLSPVKSFAHVWPTR